MVTLSEGCFWGAREDFTLYSEIYNKNLGYLHNIFFLTKSFRTTLPQIDTTQGLFVQTRRGQEVLTRVKYFMKQHILPAEKVSIV